jgi:hypothetical protein
MPETGGDGGGGQAGPGEGSFDFSSGLHAGALTGVNLAQEFGVNSPIDLHIGPTGTISPTFTGGTPGQNTMVNTVLGTLASVFGVPHALSLLGMVAGPAAGVAAGPAGMVLAMPALINTALQSLGVNTYSGQLNALSAQLADPDPNVAEAALESMTNIANEIATQHGPLSNAAPGTNVGPGAGFPGGATALGSGFSIGEGGKISNALGQQTGQSTFASNQDLANSLTQTFADLANTLGFGRSDTPEAGAPAAGPAGPGPGAGTATGDSSTGGDPGGSPY